MQTNFEDFFFSNNNTDEQLLISTLTTNVNTNTNNAYNLNENNTYRDIHTFYMDQFNQGYNNSNNYNSNISNNNNSICVSSSTERLISIDRNMFTSCMQNCEDYGSNCIYHNNNNNNNNVNNKNCPSLEYWNLYHHSPTNGTEKSTRLKAETPIEKDNSRLLQDALNGIYFLLQFV